MDIAILLNLVLGGLILGMQALLCTIWYDFQIGFVLVSYCVVLIGFRFLAARWSLRCKLLNIRFRFPSASNQCDIWSALICVAMFGEVILAAGWIITVRFITSRVVIVLHFLPQLGDIYHPCICIHRCVFLEFLCVSLLTPTAFQVFSAWSLALLSKTALDSIYSRNYNIKADMDCCPVRLYMLTNLWDVCSGTLIHSRRSTGFHTQLWHYGEGKSGVIVWKSWWRCNDTSFKLLLWLAYFRFLCRIMVVSTW